MISFILKEHCYFIKIENGKNKYTVVGNIYRPNTAPYAVVDMNITLLKHTLHSDIAQRLIQIHFLRIVFCLWVPKLYPLQWLQLPPFHEQHDIQHLFKSASLLKLTLCSGGLRVKQLVLGYQCLPVSSFHEYALKYFTSAYGAVFGL